LTLKLSLQSKWNGGHLLGKQTKKHGGLCPAVRLFCNGLESSLLTVAAREAFWDLPLDVLQQLQPHISGSVSPGKADNVVATLMGMIQSVLGCDEMAAVDCLKKRFAQNDLTCMYANEFLGMDEALEVLEPRDVQLIHAEQAAVASKATSWTRFKADDSAAVKAVKAKVAQEQKNARKTRRNKQTPVDSSIPHQDAAKYMPPQTSVWQSRTRFSWHARVAERPRISEPWHNDQGKALHRLAKRAWAQHLEMKVQGMDACPFLFDD